MEKQQSKPIQSLSFEQLFQLAQEKYEQLDYEQAEYFYSLAYQKNSFNEAVVMCYANVLKQNDKGKQAKKILQKSIKQYPNGTYKRFFQLGEIYNGVQAIKSFEAGINQALNNLKNPFKSLTTDAEIKRDVSQAYASIAEICMTDLIDQSEAEIKCTESLEKGKNIDEKCMDVRLQIANYQLFKQNFVIARNQLDIILNAVKSKQQEYESQLVLQASKYFIELDDFAKSSLLLQTIHEDQSNESEVVYLLAYCAFKEQRYDDCQDYIQEYKEGQNNIKDEQIQEAMGQLIVELNKIKPKGKAHHQQVDGMEQTGEHNEKAGGEDEWMDIEDDEN